MVSVFSVTSTSPGRPSKATSTSPSWHGPQVRGPGLLGLTGEIVVIDGNVYSKNSLTDPSSRCPSSATRFHCHAEPGCAGQYRRGRRTRPFRKILTDAGATPTLLADDKVNGQDAYHVSVSVPIDAINTLLADKAHRLPQ